MAKYHHSLLWPNATTFERSQKDYLQPMSATVPCDQRPHHLKNHNGQDAQQHCCLYKDIHLDRHGSWRCGPLPSHPKMSLATCFHFDLNIFMSLNRHVSWRCVPLPSYQVEEIRRLNTNLPVFYDFKATMITYFNF